MSLTEAEYARCIAYYLGQGWCLDHVGGPLDPIVYRPGTRWEWSEAPFDWEKK